MKERYGRETLDMKKLESQWYEKVENETSSRIKIEENGISEPTFSEKCGHEILTYMWKKLWQPLRDSAPSQEEQVFNLMIKNGGEEMARGLLYIFQKSWLKGVLPEAFFYVFVLSCVCYVLCASVYMCFVVTCWERADLLALVCGVFCEFVTFPLVSWVRCGT